MQNLECWLVLSDLHIPFHNEVLLNKIYRLIQNLKPKNFVLAGDFLDMCALAHWNAGSLYRLRNVTLTDEYEAGNLVMDELDEVLPRKCRKHFIYGNHENRYQVWLENQDNAKVGKELPGPDIGLKLKERGYRVYRRWNQDSVKAGPHLEIMHGLYTPVHSAKKHLDELQGSVVFGHGHREQHFVDGKHAAYSIGFLGDRNSPGFDYEPVARRRKWSNGFAIVWVNHKSFWVQQVHVWNDQFVVDGRVY